MALGILQPVQTTLRMYTRRWDRGRPEAVALTSTALLERPGLLHGLEEAPRAHSSEV